MRTEIDGLEYEMIENVKDAWDEEKFQERYSEILHKYDYVVGDWGFEQLRLRGFFYDKNPRSTFDTKISTVYEYLYEYCNFGCAYFILEKTKDPKQTDNHDDKKSTHDKQTKTSQKNHKAEQADS